MKRGERMQKDWIETHLIEINKLQKKLDATPTESKVQRIEILADMLVFIGRLAAEFSDQHKEAYTNRKQAYAQAEWDAPRRAQAYAELAVKEHRDIEKKAFKNMKRWDNAFITTREKINALKYCVKIDIEDGSSRTR